MSTTVKQMYIEEIKDDESVDIESVSNDTIKILKNYGFPQTAHHYTSKGKLCVLDQYEQQIIDYFVINKLNMDQFFSASLSKTQFVSDILQYLALTNESDLSPLQLALKQLYNTLQMSQFSMNDLYESNIHIQPLLNLNSLVYIF